MMNAFVYHSPSSLDGAVALLAEQWGKASVLAGGTDLLSLMKDGLETPQKVVNIKQITELNGLSVGDDAIKIGATATLAEIAGHSAIQKHLPALADAAAAIGGPQIRNQGTLGGSLCQRNRCWYFRSGVCPEVIEETRYAAIFPSGGAVYVHPSTLAPPLIAYGATVHVTGPGGARKVPVAGFFQVAQGDARETVLKANEIVTGVTVPVVGSTKSANYEVRERQSHDWPLVQAAVSVKVANDQVAAATIVLGHVGPVPVRAKDAEAALVGKRIDEAAAAAAGKAAADGAKPLSENGYKVTLVQVAVKRALLAAVGNCYWRS